MTWRCAVSVSSTAANENPVWELQWWTDSINPDFKMGRKRESVILAPATSMTRRQALKAAKEQPDHDIPSQMIIGASRLRSKSRLTGEQTAQACNRLLTKVMSSDAAYVFASTELELRH